MMASAVKRFDAEKMRRKIFQTRNGNVWMTIEFVAETARQLTEKKKQQEFVYIADRSTEILQGNLKLKKIMLLSIYQKCGVNPGWPNVLKYYLELEKLFDNSTEEIGVRMDILETIGNTLLNTSRCSEAFSYFTKAAQISAQLKDKKSRRITIKINVGSKIGRSMFYKSEQYEKDIEYYNKDLKISSEIGNRSGIASSNKNLGNAFYQLGQYEKAIEHYKKSLTIHIEIGDRSGIASNNSDLGETFMKLGHYEKAIEYFDKGLTISSEIGDRLGIASNNENLGNAFCSFGRYEEAIEHYKKTLRIHIEIGDRSGIASNNGNLGNAFYDLGHYEKAIEYFNKGLSISSEIDDRPGIASSNGNLGNAFYQLGQYEKAIEHYKKSLTIHIEIADRSGIASNNSHLGETFMKLGHYEKAIEYFDKGLTISSEIGDRLGIASNNENLGNAFCSFGRYEEAIEHYKKSLRIHIEIGDRSGIASNNSHLGKMFMILGHYEKAIEYFNKDLSISSEIDDRPRIASSNGNLGIAFYQLGQYEKAIENFNKSLTISSEIGDELEIVFGNYVGLGRVYLELGQCEKAIEYYNKGLAISCEIGDRAAIARSNGELGNAFCRLRKHEKAIEYLNKGLTISCEIGDRSGIARNNTDLGYVFCLLGQYPKGIVYYKKSVLIWTEIGDRLAIASNNGNLGTAFYSMGLYKEAIEHYKRSLTVNIEMGKQSAIAVNNTNLGSAYEKLGQYEKAIEYHQKSLTISSKIGYRLGIAGSNVNLGSVYLCLKQYEKAIEVSKRGLKESIEISDTWAKYCSAANIGLAYLSRGTPLALLEISLNDINRAISYFKISVECGDEIFSELAVDENMSSFSNQYFVEYVNLMRCFILLNRIEAALLIIDLGKAKALQAFLEQQKKTKAVNIMDYTRMIWQSIDNNEENIQTCDIAESLQLKRSLSTVLFFAFDEDDFLNIWVLNGVDTIKHVCPTESENLLLHEAHIFSSLKVLVKNFSVNLTRSSSFCELYSDRNPYKYRKGGFSSVLGNRGFVNLMKKPGCSVSKPLTRLKKLLSNDIGIRSQRDVLQRYDLDLDLENKLGVSKSKTREVVKCYDLAVEEKKSRSPPDQTDANRSQTDCLEILFEQLIKPVKHLIRGTKLIIVPDKFLFFAPFSALKDETGSSLSKHYCVQVTPSLHTLHTSMKQSHRVSVGFALFVGNPKVGRVSFCGKPREPGNLPAATTEVRCLTPMFDAKPLVEGEAVKQRVMKLIPGASIIHIAAHGDKQRGEILLSPDPSLTNTDTSLPKEESYLLREKDVMDIEINARLVVLCCCHTGRGKVASEGVIGLTRAFLAAGARSVLATLWPIDDEGTKLFMELFYAEICEETSVCEALRRAMNQFQQHENYECRKVKIWAPFTIYGEDVKFAKQDIEEIKKKSCEILF